MMKKIDSSEKNRLSIDSVDYVAQRIDNFLFNKLKNVPKSRIYRMIRSGEVRINSKRVNPTYKLKLADLVRLPPKVYSEDLNVLPLANREPGAKLIKLMLSRIVFEDRRLLVVNKPAGIAAHGGSGINFGVIEILRAARANFKNLELAHRLDRDTSGCLLLAKKKSSLRELHRIMVSNRMIKKYVLLVKGKWQGGERVVNLPLLKNQLFSGERVVTVSDQGKASLTIFSPILVKDDYSLLSAKIKTGRTHQIRVHAASIGYPIAGDKKYGDNDFNRKLSQLGLGRMFLQANELKFLWEDGESANFKIELDDKLQALLSELGN